MADLLFGCRLAELPRLVPGVALAALVVLAATVLADAGGNLLLRARGLPEGRSPIPSITVAVVLGLVAAHLLRLPAATRPGLSFCVKKVLRWGIVLIGIRLSLLDVAKQGVWAAAVVLVIVAFAVVVAGWLAPRLGVGERMGALAAASTAICGVTATLAVAPAVEADDREVAYTVANVTLYGLLGMLLYPPLAHALFSASEGSAGLFLGTAIHDTSQVTGAALAYQQAYGAKAAMDAALVTKLTRNTLLVAVVPLLAFLHARRSGGAGKRVPLARLFPLFVLGFLAMALARTAGDAGLDAKGGGAALGMFAAADWGALTRGLEHAGAHWGLGCAMAGLGLTTDFRVLRGMGLRPLWLGALTALAVGALALGLAALVGGRIG